MAHLYKESIGRTAREKTYPVGSPEWIAEQRRKANLTSQAQAQKAAERESEPPEKTPPVPLQGNTQSTGSPFADLMVHQGKEQAKQLMKWEEDRKKQKKSAKTSSSPKNSDETVTDTTESSRGEDRDMVTPEPKESGVRNPVSNESEKKAELKELLQNGTKDTLCKKTEEFLMEYPNDAAWIKYNDQYAFMLMDGKVHVFALGKGYKSSYDNMADALDYVGWEPTPTPSPSPTPTPTPEPTPTPAPSPTPGGQDEGARTIAKFKNQYGDAIEQKAIELDVDPNALAAVIFTESSGSGFYSNGDLKIRFEVGWFLDLAGSNANNYFRVNDGVHQFRESTDGQWENIHTNSTGGGNEYAALIVAASIDENAAYMSTSMGLGQQMGFNSNACGYSSAIEMFDAYSKGENVQIEGMLSFIKNYRKDEMLPALRDKEYPTFVRHYNGASVDSPNNDAYVNKIIGYEAQYKDA